MKEEEDNVERERTVANDPKEKVISTILNDEFDQMLAETLDRFEYEKNGHFRTALEILNEHRQHELSRELNEEILLSDIVKLFENNYE